MVLMFSSCLFSSYRIKTSVEDRHILNVSAFFLLSLCLLMSSADNLCKQFGPRPGPTKCRACSGSKLFDTLMVFLKDFFKKLILKNVSRRQKSIRKRVILGASWVRINWDVDREGLLTFLTPC